MQVNFNPNYNNNPNFKAITVSPDTLKMLKQRTNCMRDSFSPQYKDVLAVIEESKKYDTEARIRHLPKSNQLVARIFNGKQRIRMVEQRLDTSFDVAPSAFLRKVTDKLAEISKGQ